MMIRVKAEIKLYIGEGKRKTPFVSGYRPLFDVAEDTKTSGMITLLDREEFRPGDTGIVEIKFLDANIDRNKPFYFYESKEPLGEGVIVDFLEVK